MALTNWADRLGRRRTTVLGSGLMIASGIIFALASNYWVLLFAAVFGVISPSGNEIGPFRAVEEGMLAPLSATQNMSDIFAWHIVAGTLGASLDRASVISRHFYAGMYALIGLVKLAVALKLSDASEAKARRPERQQETEPMLPLEDASSESKVPWIVTARSIVCIFVPELSAPTRSIIWKLCLLFAVDSFASGMVAFTLVNLYLHSRFQAPISLLASLLVVPLIFSAASSLFASRISKRLGLLPTMALTHLPSAVLLGLLPMAPTLEIACLLLILRAALSTMDQGPRTVFLAQVVLPEERTKVMGVVNTAGIRPRQVLG
ncbi:hypothetical protein H2204_015358 [Knufia peltigerae]|uniref:Major facilitator superfamily (MFS) profile domain-containing protein n=1 Tax=Knufia peltigerae TaxID=1002370 RepID=A0AA39CK53_9EURO|nr:hypothetical protein H2204_015358 [Knufia peltigerae]